MEQARASAATESIGLDLIRGLAALVVVLVHVREASFVAYGALPAAQHVLLVQVFFLLTKFGREAVLIFFVLSGYLVFGNGLERALASRFDWRTYSIDRVTRIYLPLIPAILFAVLTSLVLDNYYPGTFVVLAHVLGLNGVVVGTSPINPPLWTLAYEIWFYALGGAVLYVISNHRNTFWVVAVAAAGLLVFSCLDARYLLIWIAAGIWRLRPDRDIRAYEKWLGFAAMAVGLVLFELGFPSQSFVNITVVPTAVSEVIFCIGGIVVVRSLAVKKVDVILAAVSRPIKALSKFSFSLYLFHYPAVGAIAHFLARRDRLDVTGMINFFIFLVGALAAGYLAYWLFERRTAELRKYAARRASFRFTGPRGVGGSG